MRPTRHKTGEMGHVHHQLRIDRVRDLAEPGKVYLARISRAAGNDQLGMIFAGEFGAGIIVDPLVSLSDSIVYGVQPFARTGGLCPKREVSSMRCDCFDRGLARPSP